MRMRIMAVVSGSGLVVATASMALLLAEPSPTQLAAISRATLAGTAEPDVVLVALAALGAWALTLWLCVGAALTALGRLPGLLGRCTRAVALRVVPVALRRLVEIALGVSVATGALGASAVLAAPSALAVMPTPPGPGVGVTMVGPDLDWSVGAAQRPAASPRATPLAVPVTVPVAAPPGGPVVVAGELVVHRGDSLWRIAARALGPNATDAQIAAEWPRWYAANRAVIGSDPGLLLPGQRLLPPA